MRHASGSRADARSVAAVLALAALAAACPGRAPTAPPAASTEPPRGEAVIALQHEPATLDPFSVAGQAPATRDLTRLVMPALWRIGPAGDRRRWLLADEPVVEAGPPFAVRIRLRDDAVWSDGRAITVDDLRSTWRAVVDADPPVASRDPYDRIAAIEADGPKRARIVFRRPFRRWQDLFGAGLGVLPAHGEGRRELRRAWPLSGGPFVLRGWRRGLDVRFEANPRAWGERPRLARLRFVFVPDTTSALELFRRGEVDALGPYHSPDFARRATEAGATVTSDTGSTWTGILFNTDDPVLRQRAVRRALGDAVDRERIARGLVRAEGTLLNTPLARPTPSAAGPFDPDGSIRRARADLDDAGWRGEGLRRRGARRLEFTVAVASSDGLARLVARAVREAAKRAGFELRPAGIDPDRLWAEWLPGEELQAAIVTWRDPPGGALRARLTGKDNLAGLNDERLAARLDEADRRLDPPDPWAPAEDRVATLAPVGPLYANGVSIAVRGLSGARASAGADGPFWNVHEWARAA